MKRIINVILAVISTTTLQTIAMGSGTSAKQPNIILVMTDDQGYGDLACHGHPFLQTPNLDKLYEQSTRFTDFHVSPTCAPTRSALMSGRAPFKNGVTHTILERERMALSAITMAEVLKKAGYTTGIFGKWHLGDDDEYQPDNRGFDEVFIHGAGGIGQNFPGTQGAVPGTGYFNPIIKHNNVFEQTKGYCTDVFFSQALAWIRKCAKQNKRFFAYLATNAPHGPFIAPEEYWKMYTKNTKSKIEQNFFGMITNIDDNMGTLMKKLAEWGLSDNTLLIFMTDNGTAAGRTVYNAGMKGKKGTVDRGGTRVPLFMRLPGLTKAGQDIDTLTRHYDLYPTLAELAGTSTPKDYKLDGLSLVPLLNKPDAKWPERYTCFHKGRWGKKGAGKRWRRGNCDPDKAKYNAFAIRNSKWRLVGQNKLYDIENDPGQNHNVISQHPECVRNLLKAYDAWWHEVRPMMVNEDAPLDTGKPFIEQFKKQKASEGIPDWHVPEL